jgi:hypothetical protein
LSQPALTEPSFEPPSTSTPFGINEIRVVALMLANESNKVLNASRHRGPTAERTSIGPVALDLSRRLKILEKKPLMFVQMKIAVCC